MKQIIEFISNNQILLTTALLCLTYLANKLINYMAAKPQEDVWDRIKPYSNAVCEIVFDGVEALAKTKKMPSVEKAMFYSDILKQFDSDFAKNKGQAVANLYAWYQSNKKKEVLTADTVAQE